MQRKVVFLTAILMVLMTVQVLAFTDVKPSDWFYNDVKGLQQQKIIAGYTDGSFKPHNSITSAEVLKLVTGVTGIEAKVIENPAHWSDGVVQSAYERGIIDITTFERDRNITRQEVAELLVKAMGFNSLEYITISNFKDTSSKEVNYLNSLGIIQGVKESDGVYFKPSSEITRAEVSAIVMRVLKSNIGNQNGESIEQKREYAFRKVLSESETQVVSEPKSVEQFENVLLNMASKDSYTYTIEYKGVSIDRIKEVVSTDNIFSAFSNVFAKYPEHFCFTNTLTLQYAGNTEKTVLTLNVKTDANYGEDVVILKKEFFRLAEEQLNKLVQEGKISEGMTDEQKAKVIFEWIAFNTEYDTNFRPLSYTGYGQIRNKRAVCQGYTATYNLMAKMLGLKVQGISGLAGSEGGKKEEHIWTLAELDGKKVHIDVTFGDPLPNRPNYCDYNYFGANASFMRKTHTWDVKRFGE